jgi:hypothetical protein
MLSFFKPGLHEFNWRLETDVLSANDALPYANKDLIHKAGW